jgi:hypothetical protein
VYPDTFFRWRKFFTPFAVNIHPRSSTMSFELNYLLNVRKRAGRRENDTLRSRAVNGICAGNIALIE